MSLLQKIYSWLLKITSKSDERGEYSAGFWQNKIRENAVEMASSYSNRVLEVGCGEGLFLERLCNANSKLELYGVDSWSEILLKAKTRLAGKVTRLDQADINKLPFEDNYFDGVVCINVFINLNFRSLGDIEPAIAEMVRVCKVGGRIILEFRNSLNPVINLKFRLAKYYDATVKERNLPLNAFRQKAVLNVFKKLHCKIQSVRYLDFPIKALAPIIIVEVKKR